MGPGDAAVGRPRGKFNVFGSNCVLVGRFSILPIRVCGGQWVFLCLMMLPLAVELERRPAA